MTTQTRQLIINTAIDLFNLQGTSNVSTNHIAAAMDISPGNLYYHFRNKEEIILAIFEQMVAEMDQVWKFQPAFSLKNFVELAFQTIEGLARYHFFQRETIPLMQRDTVLKARYEEMQQHRLAQLEALLQHFVTSGLLVQFPNPQVMASLAKACWMIGDRWLVMLDMEGKAPTRKNITEGILLILQLLEPYFSQQGKEEYSRLIQNLEEI